MSSASDQTTKSDVKAIHRLVKQAGQDGEADRYGGKRKWTRFTVGMLLDMTTDTANASTIQPVTMHNVSDHGFAFWARRPFTKGTKLFVREFSEDNSQSWLPTHVVHCTNGILGHLVGVEIDLSRCPE